MKKLLSAAFIVLSIHSAAHADEFICPTKPKAKKAIEKAVAEEVKKGLGTALTITSIKTKIKVLSEPTVSGSVAIASNVYGFGLTPTFDATKRTLTIASAAAEVAPAYCLYEVEASVKIKATTGADATFERFSLATKIEKFVVKTVLGTEGKTVKK